MLIKPKELIDTSKLDTKYTYVFEIYDKRVITLEKNPVTLITIKDESKTLEPSFIVNEAKKIGVPSVFCYGTNYKPLQEVKEILMSLPFLSEGFVVITPENTMFKMKTTEWSVFNGKDTKKKVSELITALYLERKIDFTDPFLKTFIEKLPHSLIDDVKETNKEVKSFLEKNKGGKGKRKDDED